MKIDLLDRPDILQVLIDGKKVISPVACDIEEGWVDIEVPLMKELEDDGAFELEDNEVDWELKRLTGKVQLVFKK